MAAPTNRTTYSALLAAKLANDGLPSEITLGATDLNSVLDEALEEFSHDTPYPMMAAVVGDDATRRFVMDTDISTDWVEEFSTLRSIRLHSNTDLDDKGRFLMPNEYAEVKELVSGVVKTVTIMTSVFASDVTAEFFFTLPHDIDASPITIPTAKVLALGNLAASIGAIWIAERASDIVRQRVTIIASTTPIATIAWMFGAMRLPHGTRSGQRLQMVSQTISPTNSRPATSARSCLRAVVAPTRLTR